LRAKIRIFEKIFTAYYTGGYEKSRFKKSAKFQSNMQVRPILEGRRFLPSGEKRQIRNMKLEILNKFKTLSLKCPKPARTSGQLGISVI